MGIVFLYGKIIIVRCLLQRLDSQYEYKYYTKTNYN